VTPLAPDEHDGTIAEQTVLAGQYEIVRKLGEGGMGEVHLAKDRHLNDRLVAVKTLPALRVASKRAMKQLRQEAVAMAELTHEHIVRFFHFGEHERIPFMVLQYIEGQTLDDLLGEQETLAPDELVELFTPLADALDYAHRKGVIHRDIKPANIFIDEHGKPYLADFGLARIAKDTITQVTGRDTTSGTLQYMSPEQCRGEWNLTPASDIYSLATVLYECLTGSVPFRTGPIRELIINEAPPRQEIEHSLAEVIMWGLAKESEARPGSCAELLGLPRDSSTERGRVVAPPPAAQKIEVASTTQPPSAGDRSHGKRFTNSIGMELVLINPPEVAPDDFLMGSPDDEEGRSDDEHQHRVILTKPYWLGVTPVTQGQYRQIMGKNPSHFKKKEGGVLGFGGQTVDLDDHPVEYISWHDAMEFLERLREKEGKPYRLPSEAEWEFACRTDSTSRFCFGDAGGRLGEYAWYSSNAGGGTHAVKGKKPNAWGLYDMHGNVWEWCADWYDKDYYKQSPEQDPPGPSSGSRRVLRGGSWDAHDPWGCRSADRLRDSPGSTSNVIGFRVCLDE
jgi:formylglycine-generating enzyme required for sulfatase activity